MAKKTKRKVSASDMTIQAPEPGLSAPVESPVRATAIPSRRVITPIEFKPDYSYVTKDLKRIGILAGSFFVILVVLSFIL